jgi:hypothetical protein
MRGSVTPYKERFHSKPEGSPSSRHCPASEAYSEQNHDNDDEREKERAPVFQRRLLALKYDRKC